MFGARLRISALRTATGPGIEFLEYLTPTDGRPMPSSERSNDLFHWHTRLVTNELTPLVEALRKARAPFISDNAVTLPSHVFGFSKSLLVRDPTGHVLQLVER